MKNLLQPIKENKKMLITVITVFLLFTVYANAKVNEYNKLQEVKQQLQEELAKEKYQKELVEALYEKRQSLINDKWQIDVMIENLIASKVKKDEEIFYTESLIRCEKSNNWKEEKDDCKTNWKNYPKK